MINPTAIAKASGVQTKGGNILEGELVQVYASPYRNYLYISNDNVGDLRIIIGGTREEIDDKILNGNFLVLNGVSMNGGTFPTQSFFSPYPVITDDIYLVPLDPNVDFKATVITDSKVELISTM